MLLMRGILCLPLMSFHDKRYRVECSYHWRNRLTKLYGKSRLLLLSWFAAMVGIVLFSSTGMASSRSMQVAATTPHFNYADTWNNIHTFLMFDGYITNPAAVAPRYDGVSAAKWYNVSQYRSTNPNMFLTYYIPFHRDNGTYTSSLTILSLKQWQQIQPSWILYKCDRKTPAYEFGDPAIPLDFSNPAVVNFQMQTYGIPASEHGYNGITADNLNMENLFGACGTYQNGKWVQRYSGKHDDGRWQQDAVNWVTAMQSALHNLPHPMALILNLGFGPALTPTSSLIQQILTHSDGILDEAGFTHYGSAFLTDQYWLQAIQLSNIEQNQGKAFYIVDDFPVLKSGEYAVGAVHVPDGKGTLLQCLHFNQSELWYKFLAQRI